MPDDLDFEDLSKLRKKKAIPLYPFSGIVGQQAMKKALLLVAVNPKIGSLLIRGENGIGKMTSAMALESLLPKIEVSTDCLSNCDIRNSKQLCIDCSDKKDLDAREVKHPFIRLPVGTSEHRIFGGFEKDGTFIPGILAMVNRGYLIMDRANLQESDLIDAILDAQEKHIFEMKKDGHEYRHPADFSLIATTNPLEHEFTKERLNRFTLVVTASSIRDVEERIEIVRRVEAYKEDPTDFLQRSTREENTLREVVHNARQLMDRAEIPKKTLATINSVIYEAGIDDDDEIIKDNLAEAAKANAVIEDRYWATVEDVSEVVDMVLGHLVDNVD